MPGIICDADLDEEQRLAVEKRNRDALDAKKEHAALGLQRIARGRHVRCSIS